MWSVRSGDASLCPSCLRGFTATLFPAFLRSRTGVAEASVGVEEGEAHCYEHSTRRAVSSCHRCGRFVCGLCEVTLGDQVWCPSCLQPENASAKPVAVLETHRTLYDSIALALATWPMLLLYPALLSWPVVLYLVVRYWKRPSSIIPRGKWRLVVASVLAVLQLGLLVAVIVGLVFVTRQRRA